MQRAGSLCVAVCMCVRRKIRFIRWKIVPTMTMQTAEQCNVYAVHNWHGYVGCIQAKLRTGAIFIQSFNWIAIHNKCIQFSVAENSGATLNSNVM